MTDSNLYAPLRTDAEFDRALTAHFPAARRRREPLTFKPRVYETRTFNDTQVPDRGEPMPYRSAAVLQRYADTGDTSRAVDYKPAASGGLHDLQHVDDDDPASPRPRVPRRRAPLATAFYVAAFLAGLALVIAGSIR